MDLGSLPSELAASDALRAQVVLAALRCGRSIEAAGAALVISPDGLRSWLGKFTGSCAWPPAQDRIEALLRLPITHRPASIGPVSRLAAIAEGMVGLPPGAVVGRSRVRDVARVRQAVCWAIRRRYGETLSYPMIGRAMGGRDHSTIQHAVNLVETLRSRDAEYAAFCDLLLMAARGAAFPPLRQGHVMPDWAIDPDGWLARREEADALADPDDDEPCESDAAPFDPLAPKSGQWCDQCDALVGAARAAACGQRFCSLREKVAA